MRFCFFLMDPGATDEQLTAPWCSARRDGTASVPDVPGKDLEPLFKTILNTSKPPIPLLRSACCALPLITTSSHWPHRNWPCGNGTIKVGQDIAVCDWHDKDLAKRGRITPFLQL